MPIGINIIVGSRDSHFCCLRFRHERRSYSERSERTHASVPAVLPGTSQEKLVTVKHRERSEWKPAKLGTVRYRTVLTGTRYRAYVRTLFLVESIYLNCMYVYSVNRIA
jgi:hypothetical protein